MNAFVAKYSRGLLFISALLMLTACATPNFIPQTSEDTVSDIQLSKVYVRGIFNWWEAEPAYLLSKGSDGAYSITMELIADGQPYDFRLSDEYWSPSNSCGGAVVTPINENERFELYCNGSSRNLQFTPTTTGIYKFSVYQKAAELILVIDRQ